MSICINTTPQEYSKNFQAKNASWISATHKKIDGVMLPFPQESDELILYHGTDAESQLEIERNGFSLSAPPKNKGKNNVGEFCDAISFSPSDKVASVFGDRVLVARVKIKQPYKVLPSAWSSVMMGIQLKVSSEACEAFGGQSVAILSRLKEAGIIPQTIKQIISDYIQSRHVDGIFCEDSITPQNLNLRFKQSQWAIYDPQNIDLVGTIRKPISNLKFRCHFVLMNIERGLSYMR